MWRWTRALESLLELIYPERCTLCGTEPHEGRWFKRGCRVDGLRVWDGTHLCAVCGDRLEPGCITGRVAMDGAEGVAVAAAVATNPDLVKLVGNFKYHGVRGLAWPLAGMLSRPLATSLANWGPVDALVPVALHSRRLRARGFNQAEILARLAARESEIPVVTDVLVRRRNTGQQAKIPSSPERIRNMETAFCSKQHSRSATALAPGANRILLVDDLVTSGSTAVSAAGSLREAGWDVRGIVALGLVAKAKNGGPRVDTWKGGF